jgi:hypothetical protein
MADKSLENKGPIKDTRFKKGMKRAKGAGRKPGQQNRISVALRDAIINAAEYAGHKRYNPQTQEFDLPGEGGLQGYCDYVALKDDGLMVQMLLRVLPMHILPSVVNKNVYRTEDDIRQMCEEAGIDFESMRSLSVEVPRHMIDVTPASKDQRDD